MGNILLPIADELLATDKSGSAAKKTSTILFKSDTGAPLKLAGGVADLSGLVAGAEGGKVQLQADPGAYRHLKITVANKAKIKGCVKMLYRCSGGAPSASDLNGNNCSGQTTDDLPGWGAGGSGSTSMHLYCTQTTKSRFASLSGATKPQNSDFENKDPELMDFELSNPSSQTPSTEDVNLSFVLPDVVQLEADKPAPQITLLIDLNRMLRYYNRGEVRSRAADGASLGGPNPGSPNDTAYFFTSVFQGSTYAFIGQPGRIYGYEMEARVCNQANDGSGQPRDQIFNPTTHQCANGAAPANLVPFWMTLITSPTGSPLRAILTPDDDNALTITKSSPTDYTRCPGYEETRWATGDNATGKGIIRYALCDNNHAGKPGPYGKLFNFPIALDDTAIGSDVSGVLIESHSNQEYVTPTPNARYYLGEVIVKRRL